MLYNSDILLLTPAVLHIILHVPAKEAGDLPVRGTTIARNKTEINLFYAFQGGKRITWTHWDQSSAWFSRVAGLGVG